MRARTTFTPSSWVGRRLASKPSPDRRSGLGHHFDEIGNTPREAALGRCQRINNREMVSCNHLFEAGGDAGAAPSVGQDPTLTQKFTRLLLPNDNVQQAPMRRRPKQWR